MLQRDATLSHFSSVSDERAPGCIETTCLCRARAVPKMAEHSVQWARVIEEKSKDPTFAKEHQGWLQNSTFEDTQKQFRDAKTQHENSSTGYKAIEKMEPLLEGFDRFGGFAAEMATLEPHGIGSLCVGSLRIVVTVDEPLITMSMICC